MPERHPGKIEPVVAFGRKTDSWSWRAARGLLQPAPQPCSRAGAGECGSHLPQRLLVGLRQPGTLAGQAGKGAAGPQEAALSCSIPLLEPTMTFIRAPTFLASLCRQGRTILSPEAEPPVPSSSLLSPPGPGSSAAGWGCLL